MKLAEVESNGRHVTLSRTKNSGYIVHFHDSSVAGSSYFIPDRQAAERTFLWDVGYPEWQKAADDAFKASRDAWLATHTTLASVGAKVEPKP